MKKKLSISLWAVLLMALAVQAQTFYYIRMADSTYSAQLRGIAGTTSAGETITGAYNTTRKAHRFTVTKTGPYDLFVITDGGTTYIKDSGWSGAFGKIVAGDDLKSWMIKLNPSYQAKSIGLGDTSVSTAKIKDLNVTTGKIAANAIDSTKLAESSVQSTDIKDGQVKTADLAANAVDSTKIALSAVTTTDVKDATLILADLSAGLQSYIGSGGQIPPDEVSITNNAGYLSVKDGGVDWLKLSAAVKDSIGAGGTGGSYWTQSGTDISYLTGMVKAPEFVDSLNVKMFGAVGDGVTDDTQAIRSALDRANALGGGTVYFPNGTYITQIDTIHSNTQLLGTRGSIIKRKANTNLHMFLMDGANNILISGLELDGNSANQDSTNLLTTLIRADNTTNFIVENCFIYNTTAAAIYSAGNADGAIVRNNKIENHGGAVNFYYSDSVVIHHNYINNKGYARSVNPTAIGLDDVSFCVISDNYIINEPYVGGGDGRFGIEIYNVSGANQIHNKVIGNTIVAGDTNFCYGGISLAGSDYSQVSNNLIYNARDIGAIEIASSDYCTVTSNQIDSFIIGINLNSASFGANISGNTFSNTPFSAPDWGFGISVDGSGADSSANRFHLFDGNYFHKVHNPHRFNGSGGWSTISNSQADSCDHFIFMYHSSYGPMNFMHIQGNKIISSDRFFSLYANDADTLKGWTVSGNESTDQLDTDISSKFLNYSFWGNKGFNLTGIVGTTFLNDRVGIKNTTPQASLDVRGSANVGAADNVARDSSLTVGSDNDAYYRSLAVGWRNVVQDTHSYAYGYSFATGDHNRVMSRSSAAFGNGNYVRGDAFANAGDGAAAFAFGNNNYNYASSSLVMGEFCRNGRGTLLGRDFEGYFSLVTGQQSENYGAANIVGGYSAFIDTMSHNNIVSGSTNAVGDSIDNAIVSGEGNIVGGAHYLAGDNSFTTGQSNTNKARYGWVGGYSNYLGGGPGFIYGEGNKSDDGTYGNTIFGLNNFADTYCYQTIIGTNDTTKGWYSLAIGHNINIGDTGGRTMAIGTGVDAANPFRPTAAYSFNVAFKSTVPTFTVTEASGVGTYGKVGIGMAPTNAERLQVSGGFRTDSLKVGSSVLVITDFDTIKTASGSPRWLKITAGGSTYYAKVDTTSSAAAASDSAWNAITLGSDAENASGQINLVASDNDQGAIAITTGDALSISGFTGGVGIGTDSPSDLLHLYKDDPTVILENPTVGNAAADRDSYVRFYGYKADGTRHSVSYIKGGRISSTTDNQEGGLGIYVNDGDDGFSPSILALNIFDNSAGQGGTFVDCGPAVLFRINSSGGSYKGYLAGSATAGKTGTHLYSSDHLLFYSGNTTANTDICFAASANQWENMRITYAGNVGIGTAVPTGILQVSQPQETGNALIISGKSGTELITNAVNQDFSGAGNWTGTNWAISSAALLHTTGATTNATLANANLTASSIVSGSYYVITMTIGGMTAGTLTPKIGTATSPALSASGTYYVKIRAAASNADVIITPTSTFDGSIDNISVMLVSDKSVILGNGNIGIGTTTPGYWGLNVAKSAYITDTLSANVITDRTKFFNGLALPVLEGIKAKDDKIWSEVDHSSLPIGLITDVKAPKTFNKADNRLAVAGEVESAKIVEYNKILMSAEEDAWYKTLPDSIKSVKQDSLRVLSDKIASGKFEDRTVTETGRDLGGTVSLLIKGAQELAALVRAQADEITLLKQRLETAGIK